MQTANLIPEFKSMGKHFLLYLAVAPILAYAIIQVIDWVKKSWRSGSQKKKWFSLTFVILALLIAIWGL